MRRVVIPTLEKAGARGGIARYIDALVLTYPAVRVERILRSGYESIFPVFWKTHHDTDLYLIQEILPVGTVAWLTKLTGSKPYVIFLHGMDFDLATRNSWKRWLTKTILRGAEAIVVNSEALRRDLAAPNPYVSAERIFVIYPPVSDVLIEAAKGVRKGKGWSDLRDLTKLAAGAIGMPISTTSRPLLASGTGSVHLLTVARLVERKGHMKVLEAMTKLPGTKYTIVGSGPMKAKIEERIAELGLVDRVKMIPDADDETLPDIYTDADIFVMPTSESKTEREGFGIVYLEANLFGLPVVGTRTGGVSEAIVDGKTGVLVEDNVDALVEALRTLIDNPTLRSAMGSRGRVRVLEQFTREEQMGKLRESLFVSH